MPIQQAANVISGSLKLYGTLLLPDQTQNSCPVALIIAGSGPTDRDGNNPKMLNNSLKFLAEALAEKGIASLRYDKRRIGESVAEAEQLAIENKNLRFEHYVADAQWWLTQLMANERFSQIYVIGHSEGSLIGILACDNLQINATDKLAGLISIAGAGRPLNEVIHQQLANQSTELAALAKPILQQLANGKSVDQYPEALAALFHPSIQSYLISQLKYNPLQQISKMKIPCLILQGDHDLQVTIDDAKLLSNSQPLAKLAVIPQMNHVLKISPADREKNIKLYQQPDIPIAHKLIQAIEDFIY